LNIGKIEQLTNNPNYSLEKLRESLINNKEVGKLTILQPSSKSELITRLKAYQFDYEATEDNDAIQKVIDWFINVTPDYIEEV